LENFEPGSEIGTLHLPTPNTREAGDVQRFRGGLVFKAHRLCVSLNSRLESNNEEKKRQGMHHWWRMPRGHLMPSTPTPQTLNPKP